ncbi:hypothetical protein DUI87_00792 [Hirundo rustica rustica]|uniref:Uncharacterized protein n=1 Tax=Hirundo rustica rustica TaxID=333673 RepID=A0A3M0LAP7_HIRRU|nr:hypothetical protein DUI87_00792 [Hirundo rustica rustica]
MTASKGPPSSGRRNSPRHSGALPAQPGLSGSSSSSACLGFSPGKPEASSTTAAAEPPLARSLPPEAKEEAEDSKPPRAVAPGPEHPEPSSTLAGHACSAALKELIVLLICTKAQDVESSKLKRETNSLCQTIFTFWITFKVHLEEFE